jgi:hypothetical protein
MDCSCLWRHEGAYLLYIIKGALHLKALVSRHFGLLDSYCPDGHIFAGAAGRERSPEMLISRALAYHSGCWAFPRRDPPSDR